MSNNKHFADLLKVCSILPALAIMPAMAEDFMQNGASKKVENGEIFDLSQYDSVLFDGGAKIQNYGTVKLGGDVCFENATMHNNNSSVEEQKKIVYEGDGNITFVNSRISNPGVEYNSNPPAIVGGLVDFRTTGDISFSGDMEPTGSSAYVNTTILSDMVLQANKISVSGAKSDGYGGAIFNAGDLKILGKENLFTDNHQTAVAAESKYYKLGGGALYNRGAEGTAELVVGLADGSSVNKFISNSALQNGGAIETRTDDPNSHSVLDVIGKTTFSENTAGVNGGAIMNWVDSSQENATSVINIIGEVNFDNNTAGENGGAIYNNGTLDLTGAESTFVGNSAGNDGGAIYNEGTLDIEDAEFVVNSAKRYGGGIANYSKLVLNNVDFEKNNAYVGGAMFLASGSDTIISNSVFDNNTADYGGAVYTATGIKNVNVSDSKFTNNSAKGTGAFGLFNKGTLTNVLFENNKSTDATSSAGALFLGSLAQAQLDSVQFVKNTSASAGGAIATRVAQNEDGSKNRNDGTLDIVDGEFVSNSADGNGGAIYNSFHDSVNAAGAVYVHDVEFVANSAKGKGGAIYNDGKQDLDDKGGVMSLSDVDFAKNTADGSGGAIFNNGKLSIADAEFEGNKIIGGLGDGGAIYSDGSLTITNSDFSDNYAKENVDGDVGYGGAIFARGEKVEIKGGEFENNHALTAGAVYISKHALTTTIDGVEFEGNWASDIGALAVMGKDVTLNNLKFANNYTTGDFAGFNDGAGALFFGSESQSKLTGGNFVNNTSASRGGAIATRVAQNEGGSKNRNDGTLDIVDSSFVKNTAATDGGAIYNTFYNSVEAAGGAYVAKSSFVGNKATNGGAIYNDGTEDYNGKHAVLNLSDLTFADNIASDKGGAIFNGADAVINMSGTNAFTNNTANKGANDIYNAGTLNITGGETTIGGGILGNGTLTLAEGAVLNVGNATIRQDNLDIDGIVKVSVLSDRSYGRLIAAKDLDVADTAELHLSLGSVGEYDMFGGQDAGFKTIEYGDTYNVTELDGGIIKVETKSVEQLAQDTGLTTQAAGVVAGLANSHDSTLQHISLAAQQALNAGDKALVEQEAKKLNPEEKPVVQALASAVQNQVLSLASGRMAGAVAMGRAGGDSSQENGFWMHGLFNKSKLDGQFHGYTRGVAFGMDSIIDGKYILGGGLAFNNSDVHSSGRGDTDIDSKTLFLYGQYKPNNWFANMTLTYNMAEYDETKSVFGYNINNVYDVDSYGAQIMGGYDFNTGITTEAGLRYLHIDQDAYADINATKTDFLTSVAGIKYAFAIENDWAIELRPELRAALTYDIISEADAATIDMPGVASYKVAGEKLDRLGGEFGIGLTADYKGLKVTLMYDLDLHKDYTSQTGMIKFRTQF